MPIIRPGALSHSILREIYQGPQTLELDPSCWEKVTRSRNVVTKLIDDGETVYGLNTGFGLLANQRISTEDLAQLQVNLVRSHSAGYGELLDDSLVRLIMLLKTASLARGFSGA